MSLRSRLSDPVVVPIAFALAVCFAAVTAQATRIVLAYDAQITRTQAAANNLTRSLARHGSDALIQADAVLLALVARLNTAGVDDQIIAELHRVLVLEMGELPQLQRLSIIGADGLWITTDLTADNPGVQHADREYFQYHRTHDGSDAHLGPPIQSRTTDQWIITISRRFNHADGSFAGVVLASIDLEYFNRYYNPFDIGADGAILLAMSDGTVLDRRPFREDLVGTNIANSPLFKDYILKGESGTATVSSSIDGIERVTAFKKIDRFPAYVVVAMSKDEALRGWRIDAIVQCIAGLLFAVVLALVGQRLVKRIRASEALQAELLEARNALQLLDARLSDASIVDELTGLANRREFDRIVRDEVKRIDRGGGLIALITIDVDRFRVYNDYFGRPKGDACLRMIADKLKTCVRRPGDLAARIGGEEFAVLLPSTDANGAMAVAQAVREAIGQEERIHPGSSTGIVTVSMGIAVVHAGEAEANVESLLVRADKALYAAKEAGRDQIKVHALRIAA